MISYSNNKPLSFDELTQFEKEIYKKQLIKIGEKTIEIDINNIFSREKNQLYDRFFNMPQNLFFLNSKKYPIILGRKILSQLYINGEINALNCSQVSASMLLGFLISQKKGKEIFVEYIAFKNGEKLKIFNEILKDKLSDIYYPYQYLDFETGFEKICKPEGWKFSPEKVIYLGSGEKHIRSFTLEYFNGLVNDGDIVFDPACSTGEFLHTFKQKFPQCRTIGQDLSSEMTKYAKNFVDEIYTGDSINSPIQDNYVNIMFLRFLNSEIVTKKHSYILFNKLVKKVKKGGIIVLFGHTPVLLEKEYFLKSLDFEVLNSIGYNSLNNTIFQYYVIKRQ